MSAIITIDNLGKRYFLRHQKSRQPYTALRDVITEKAAALSQKFLKPFELRREETHTEREEFWALKNVSFEVKQGERIGIIGRNGAGKSTLLKILSRITEPTVGEVKIRGRVASLLEVGTGFHPELTGRENVFLNGAILGMRRGDIKKKFDQIVDFAEIEKFLDTPVKRYSSGMYVRLAFAVAAHLEPEILIVDEVLAVGDAQFQKKCLGRMDDVAKEGRTVLFVSHNMSAIRMLCSTSILFSAGEMEILGSTENVIGKYLVRNLAHSGHWHRTKPIPSAAGIYFDEITILDHKGNITAKIDPIESFRIAVSARATEKIPSTQIAMRVTNQEGIPLFTTANSDFYKRFLTLSVGKYKYEIKMPARLLPPGLYSLTIAAMIPNQELFDVVENEVSFEINDVGSHVSQLRDGRLGVVAPILEWQQLSADNA